MKSVTVTADLESDQRDHSQAARQLRHDLTEELTGWTKLADDLRDLRRQKFTALPDSVAAEPSEQAHSFQAQLEAVIQALKLDRLKLEDRQRAAAAVRELRPDLMPPDNELAKIVGEPVGDSRFAADADALVVRMTETAKARGFDLDKPEHRDRVLALVQQQTPVYGRPASSTNAIQAHAETVAQQLGISLRAATYAERSQVFEAVAQQHASDYTPPKEPARQSMSELRERLIREHDLDLSKRTDQLRLEDLLYRASGEVYGWRR